MKPIEKTLKQIINDYGKDVLSNGTQVVNLFADYCPGEAREKAKLKSAYELGIIQELIRSTNGQKDATAAISKAIQDLKEKAFMDEGIAREFIYEIAAVLKLKYTPITPSPAKAQPQQSPVAKQSTPSTTKDPQQSAPAHAAASYTQPQQSVRTTSKKRIKPGKILLIASMVVLIALITLLIVNGIDKKNRGDCELELSSDGSYYTVTGYNGKDKVVTIPSVYKGVPVKVIGSDFSDSIAFSSGSDTVKEVIIPDSVTRIEDGAFAHCYSLKTITIPASVTHMGKYVFYYCTNLMNITIPNSVTFIGEGTFDCCHMLDSISFGGTATQWYRAYYDDRDNKEIVSEFRVYCTDNTITYRPSKKN